MQHMSRFVWFSALYFYGRYLCDQKRMLDFEHLVFQFEFRCNSNLDNLKVCMSRLSELRFSYTEDLCI